MPPSLALLRSFPPLYAAALRVCLSKDSRTGRCRTCVCWALRRPRCDQDRLQHSPCEEVGAVSPISPPPPNSTTTEIHRPQTTATTARRAYLSKLLRILRIDASKCRTIARIWYKNDLKTITTDCHRLHCHPLPLGGNLPLAGGNLLEKVAIC